MRQAYLLPEDRNDEYDDSPLELLGLPHQEETLSLDVSLESSPQTPRQKKRYWAAPTPQSRCSHIINVFQQRAEAFGVPRSVLVEEYQVQSVDYNVFFRATAQIFWLDFAGGLWSNFTLSDINIQPIMDGVPLTKKSLYTWITGDQHLSNFGAWKNRGGEVVFSVNDFDEAAIYGMFQHELSCGSSFHSCSVPTCLF